MEKIYIKKKIDYYVAFVCHKLCFMYNDSVAKNYTSCANLEWQTISTGSRFLCSNWAQRALYYYCINTTSRYSQCVHCPHFTTVRKNGTAGSYKYCQVVWVMFTKWRRRFHGSKVQVPMFLIFKAGFHGFRSLSLLSAKHWRSNERVVWLIERRDHRSS